MDNHPITPSSELINQWETLYFDEEQNLDVVLIQAYQAGADQELEACCEVLARELICDGKHVATDLRAVRRPKPPSLKEQALQQLRQIPIDPEAGVSSFELDIIRRALEQLPDE